MGAVMGKVSCFPDIPSPYVEDIGNEDSVFQSPAARSDPGKRGDPTKSKLPQRKTRSQTVGTFTRFGERTKRRKVSSRKSAVDYSACGTPFLSDSVPQAESKPEKGILEGAGSMPRESRRGSLRRSFSRGSFSKQSGFASSITTPEFSKVSSGSDLRLDRSPNYMLDENLQLQMRLAQIDNGFDHDINKKLFEHPLHVQLRFQIMNLMKRRSAHEGADLKFWDEQIRCLQDHLISDFVKEFGKARSEPYIASLRQYWACLDEMHKKSSKNGAYSLSTDFDGAKFFEYFDFAQAGLITLEEFYVIAEVIDPGLIHGKDEARVVFMFLNQSERDSFSEYDLNCFMKKSWGGVVGKFHASLRKYMKENSDMDPESMRQLMIAKYEASWGDVDAFQFDVGVTAAKTSISFDVNHSDLIRNIRQLRKDISENSPSIAFDRDCYFSDSEEQEFNASSNQSSLLGLDSCKSSFVPMSALEEQMNTIESFDTAMTERSKTYEREPSRNDSAFWNMQLEIENMMIGEDGYQVMPNQETSV